MLLQRGLHVTNRSIILHLKETCTRLEKYTFHHLQKQSNVQQSFESATAPRLCITFSGLAKDNLDLSCLMSGVITQAASDVTQAEA